MCKRGRTATSKHSLAPQEAQRKRRQVRVSRNHVSRPEAEQLSCQFLEDCFSYHPSRFERLAVRVELRV